VYNLLEATFDYFEQATTLNKFAEVLNRVLERASSGFRILVGKVTPIVTENEITPSKPP
jgi:hypothetical protein